MTNTNIGESRVVQRVVKKKTEPIFDARTAYLTFLIICSAFVSAWLGGWNPLSIFESDRLGQGFPGSAASPGSQGGTEIGAAWKLTVGNDLFEKGLYEEAAEMIEGALLSPGFSPPMAPGAFYRLGILYADSMDQPRKAAKWFAAAKKLAAGQGGKLENDAARRLVECLERSGQPREAKKVLAESADLKPSKDSGRPSGETVLASIDGREITLMALEAWVPEHLRSRLDTSLGRSELLRQYLARELLMESALRAGIERRPEVASRIEGARKDILADGALKAELSKIPDADDGTLELFIKADPKRWSTPWEATLSTMTLTSEASAAGMMKRLNNGEGFMTAAGSLPIPVTSARISSRSPSVEGLGRLPSEVVEKLSALGEGDFLGPVVLAGSPRIFRAAGISAPRLLTLAEAGGQVRGAWRAEAEARASRECIELLLGSGEVRIFENALKNETSDGAAEKLSGGRSK